MIGDWIDLYVYTYIVIILYTHIVRDVYLGNTQLHYVVYPVHAAVTKQNTNKIAF